VLEKGSRPVFLLSVGNKENNIASIQQTAHKSLCDESFPEYLVLPLHRPVVIAQDSY